MHTASSLMFSSPNNEGPDLTTDHSSNTRDSKLAQVTHEKCCELKLVWCKWHRTVQLIICNLSDVMVPWSQRLSRAPGRRRRTSGEFTAHSHLRRPQQRENLWDQGNVMAVFEGHQAIQFVENTKFVGWLGFVRFCCFVTVNWKKK